jgi:hypothetical protein
MDYLNDFYPLYPPNPDPPDESFVEASRKRKKKLDFSDFCNIHSDDLWYLWCMITEFSSNTDAGLLSRMDYAMFCSLCYENS